MKRRVVWGAESVREKLREKGVVPLLVKALKNFPDNNGVLANTATAFRELGRDGACCTLRHSVY